MAIDFKEIERRLDEVLENTTKESWEQWLMEEEYKEKYAVLRDKSLDKDFSFMGDVKIQWSSPIFNEVKFSESNNDVDEQNYKLAA